MIARQRVTLPRVFSMGKNYEKTMQQLFDMERQYCAEWQHSPLLKGEQVLLLDEQNIAVLNGYRITYSLQGGLEYEKEGADLNE